MGGKPTLENLVNISPIYTNTHLPSYKVFNNFYKGKKVLITGHTGFKGSWLTIWLNMLGAKVIGYALDPKTKKDNFVLTGIAEEIKDYRGDIRDKEKIFKLFTKEKPEIVFHLAAQPLVLESYKNPAYTYETNIMGIVNVLESIRKIPSVHTAIIITSDKCYENKEQLTGYCENDPMGGYDPYSSSKGAAELIITAYRNSFFNPEKFIEHQKSIASARAGNVIGGGDWSDYRLIPDCIKSIENGEIIKVRNPDSVRPWQHVLEPLGGYLWLGYQMMNEPGKFNEAWNFGPDENMTASVNKVVENLIKIYGKGEWEDIYNKNKQHEAGLLKLDITKARQKLKWEPLLDLTKTLKLTVEWYKNYKKQNPRQICEQQIEMYMQQWKLNQGS